MKETQVVYRSKHGEEEKIFDAVEWLAAMCSHLPDKEEHMVRYYRHYSNVSRGKRKKAELDELIPSILEPGETGDVHKFISFLYFPGITRNMASAGIITTDSSRRIL